MKKVVFAVIGLIMIFISGVIIQDVLGTSLENDVLRLHVVANSDSPQDQKLKLAVKDRVVTVMREQLVDVPNAQVARQLAINQIPMIQQAAEEVIIGQGYNYPVNVKVAQSDFPTKKYGNLVFPAGVYQAVKVEIGSAEGKNWWCVLFPPLCMVSTTDQGLSMDTPQDAKVSLKCLKLLPKGLRVTWASNE